LPPLLGLELTLVADGFDQPVLAVAPAGDDRLFVVERSGTIRIVGVEQPFLDISDRVNSEDGIEPGLLGLAFHPGYTSNGRFFVFYYRAGAEQTTLAEFEASADPDVADPATERTLLLIDKPTNRHNGGMLEFGPEGELYVALGEGGAASVNAQDPSTLLGSILRIDVDGGEPYGVPPGNPFVDGGGAPEVWVYGLRNPWRFAIDPVERLVYIGDVGHESLEEVDVVALDGGGGTNFGWLRMEGTECFQAGCDPEAEHLTLPVYEYPHAEGCSITAGRVYRGAAIPEMTGRFFFSDWCTGWIRSLRLEGATAVDVQQHLDQVGQVNGFGEDASGELYVLTWAGELLRLDPSR
jgi:hypothetical protein